MATIVAKPPRDGMGALPPVSDRDGGDGGGGSGWVQLLKAANDIEAHLLVGRLNEAGIEVSVLKDRSAPGAWLYGGSNPWAPVIVMVRQLQLTDARMVLAEISFEAPGAEDRSIPARLRDWRTPVVWWALALGLGVLMTGVALGRTAVVMERCDLPLLCGDLAPGR